MNIEIAGVNFVIESRHKINLQELPPSYGNFLIRDISAHDIIKVSLELNNIPAPIMTKIFDTDESWSMFVNDDEYFVALNPPVLNKRIVWLARFKKDFSKTIIYCSKMLMPAHQMTELTKVINPLCYPLDQILLMYYLSQREGALIHCAGLEYDGRGFIFPGRSGAGKSTISRNFVLKNHVVLSDDRVAIRKIGGSFTVFGTPWSGDAEIAENRSLPLRGIFFIRKSDEIVIKELTPAEAAERLMPVTSIPWYDEEAMSNILSFCEDLVLHIPSYDLYFTPGVEVVDFFEKFISK
jgi:hypothetical protein